jgi:DNA repair protein RecN (Recombination protein N)
LAAFGNQHFHVMKQVVDGRTVTVVEILSDTRRVDELAQMFGGKNDVNLAAAQETLNAAVEFRQANL